MDMLRLPWRGQTERAGGPLPLAARALPLPGGGGGRAASTVLSSALLAI
jgi:hypothetical protein